MFRSSHKIFPIAGVVILCILSAAFLIGIRSAWDLKRVVTAQFNQEQLIVARQIASEIEGTFENIIYEMGSFSRIYPSLSSNPTRLFSLLKGVLTHFHPVGARGIYLIKGQKIQIQIGSPLPPGVLKKKLLQGVKFLSPLQVLIISPPCKGGYRVVLLVNAYIMASHLVGGIHSGKTGYAWIINDKGYFIYHPIKRFVGENAFKARHNLAKNFYFKKINEIQKKEMLKGKEGTGEYVSLWHGKMRGYIKKVVAYTPAKIIGSDHFWSVAVCAPEKEINESIHYLYLKQFIIQGSLVLALLFIGISLIYEERRFRGVLEEEIKKKTETLKKSQERYRRLIEAADDLILTMDEEGKILSFNLATIEFFHLSSQELNKITFYVLMQWSRSQFKKHLESLKNRGRSITEEHTVTLTNRTYWLSTKLMPLHPGEILCISRNITKEKEIQTQLSNTEKLASLGTLAAGVAHEINNPLGIIIGFGELLAEELDPDSHLHEDINLIIKHALHCKKIVENLLNFARNSQEFFETTEVNEAIEEILTIIGHTLELNQISLHTSLSPTLPLVKGERRKLQQVFLNLIINAIDAMPNGGSLEIITEKHKQGVKILVKDTGGGIKQEYLDKIFDPFFTTKPEGKGTGLGLSITYGIIKQFGGDIEVESQEGKGSTFIITLQGAGENEDG